MAREDDRSTEHDLVVEHSLTLPIAPSPDTDAIEVDSKRHWAPWIVSTLVTVVVANHLAPTGVGEFLHHGAQLGVVVFLAAVTFQKWIEKRTVTASLIAIFGVSILISQVGWTLTDQISGPAGLGSPFDVVYSIGLPFGVVGFTRTALSGVPSHSWQRIVTDTMLVVSAISLALWAVVFSYPQSIGDLGQIHVGLFVAPAGDVVALSICIVAAFHQTHDVRFPWLIAALCVAGVGDVASALHRADGHMSVHLAVLVSWMCGPLMLGIALSRAHPDGASDFSLATPRRHLLIWFAAVGVAGFGFVIIRNHRIDVVTQWLGLALGCCVVLNQSRVMKEFRDLIIKNTATVDLLKLSEDQFRLAFDGAPVGIAIIDGQFIRGVNPRLCELFGLPESELVNQNARNIVDYDQLPAVEPTDWQPITSVTDGVSFELRVSRPDGTEAWLSLSVAKSIGTNTERTIAIVEDVTERRAATDRLAHLAVTDQLTGLPNRTAFIAELEEALDSPTESGVAVAFLDLDRFKAINDSLGHAAGDRVLSIVAERITDTVGEHGTVARFAGDEFTMLLYSASRAETRDILDRVRDAVSAPVNLRDGMTNYPSVSVGVSWQKPGAVDADRALAEADVAMYRAKARGRNRTEFFDAAVNGDATSELRMLSEMHAALDRHEFRAFYQPVVDLQSGMTVGYESLMRWEHPTRGLLAPAAFMDAAEESGLIVPMGEWILRESLGQLAVWNEAHPGRALSMSVNLAARQISEPFVELLDDVLASTGVSPDALWLEITETALMSDIRLAEAVLDRLRGMGVHLTIDDFGTGYSSLTYLRRFPVEGIKIDKTFTDGLGRDAQADAICEGVVSLGTALGMKTVAEGIEHRVQRDALREMGCPFGQGFLFGRPVPASEIDAVLGVETPAELMAAADRRR